MNKATVDSVMEFVRAVRVAVAVQIIEPCEANIGELEIADAALRAEVERLAAQAGKQDVTNLTQERALARRHGFLDAMSGGTARELCTLLRYGVKQLEAWHAKYGEDQPDWLPPAGDVRWMEDVASALDGRAIAQQPAQAEPAPAPVGEYPALPEPSSTAYIQGHSGGEYRTLSDSYEPDCAMFSPQQMHAYIDADRAQRPDREVRLLTSKDIADVRETLWRNTQVNLSDLHAEDAAKAFQRKFCEVNGLTVKDQS